MFAVATLPAMAIASGGSCESMPAVIASALLLQQALAYSECNRPHLAECCPVADSCMQFEEAARPSCALYSSYFNLASVCPHHECAREGSKIKITQKSGARMPCAIEYTASPVPFTIESNGFMHVLRPGLASCQKRGLPSQLNEMITRERVACDYGYHALRNQMGSPCSTSTVAPATAPVRGKSIL